MCEFEVDDVYDIPPGHDATVVGDETFEAIEFASARIFAMPTDGDRVLAAVLCTDIVDSTSHLRRLGDSAWRELLTEHNRQTRGELNRFRGREIQTTGDGFLAVFEGPARAVRCAQAIGSSVGNLGIAIRAGIHTGEVELIGADVRGLAVHEAARVAGAATAGEVLVSATTKLLLAGSALSFESAGIHQLKGLGDACELLRLPDLGEHCRKNPLAATKLRDPLPIRSAAVRPRSWPHLSPSKRDDPSQFRLVTHAPVPSRGSLSRG